MGLQPLTGIIMGVVYGDSSVSWILLIINQDLTSVNTTQSSPDCLLQYANRCSLSFFSHGVNSGSKEIMKILDFILCGVPPSKKRAYGRNQRMSFRDSIVSTRVFTLIFSVYFTVLFYPQFIL